MPRHFVNNAHEHFPCYITLIKTDQTAYNCTDDPQILPTINSHTHQHIHADQPHCQRSINARQWVSGIHLRFTTVADMQARSSGQMTQQL